MPVLLNNGGLIPAYAGKTQQHECDAAQSSAHPRVCGENQVQSIHQGKHSGSSPRMRGKLDHNAKDMPHRGLIPAYAGKTTAGVLALSASAAHPRVCGEHPVSSNRAAVTRGSSPRMRGKRAGPGRSGGPCGLIPAYAGKTLVKVPSTREWVAHPRVCGENTCGRGIGFGAFGSSPRMRGKLAESLTNDLSGGLIPAYAGKTSKRRRHLESLAAHPRVCGENGISGLSEDTTTGSSPRMRGKLDWTLRTMPSARLIPAYAGKT